MKSFQYAYLNSNVKCKVKCVVEGEIRCCIHESEIVEASTPEALRSSDDQASSVAKLDNRLGEPIE